MKMFSWKILLQLTSVFAHVLGRGFIFILIHTKLLPAQDVLGGAGVS